MKIEEQIHGVMEIGKQPAPALIKWVEIKPDKQEEVSQVCCAIQLGERSMTQMKF